MTGPLGKKTSTPTSFSPDVLFPIKRVSQRQSHNLETPKGIDIWNIHEVYWLDHDDNAHQHEMSLSIPSNSENTIESKSMKLFINSLMHKRFESFEKVSEIVKKSVEGIVGSEVTIDKLHLPEDISSTNIKINTEYQLRKQTTKELKIQRFRGFRSLCPVTAQPDLADIYLDAAIDTDFLNELSAYLGSYFDKECFHELCIELIHHDLVSAGIDVISTKGFFERRGGIAIIPIRFS